MQEFTLMYCSIIRIHLTVCSRWRTKWVTLSTRIFQIKNQPVVYSDYVIFVAEVASTCNEALLMQYLLKNTEDKKQRAYLINYFLEQFRTTLYRQTMFAEFELKINEMVAAGESLTAEGLNELYGELKQALFR